MQVHIKVGVLFIIFEKMTNMNKAPPVCVQERQLPYNNEWLSLIGKPHNLWQKWTLKQAILEL